MNYVIKFRDRTSKTISKDRGELLKEALLGSAKMVDIDDKLIRASEILSVEPEKRWQSDIPTMTHEQFKQLSGGCRGTNSIAKAIIKVAVTRKMIPKLADPQWRKEIREALWTEYPDTKWCDPDKQFCGCATI